MILSCFTNATFDCKTLKKTHKKRFNPNIIIELHSFFFGHQKYAVWYYKKKSEQYLAVSY